MTMTEPNKNAPPSPADPGFGNVSPLGSAFGWPTTLLVQFPGFSPGSQKQALQPHMQYAPPPPGMVWPASAPPERQRIITDIARHFFTVFNISSSLQDELLARRIIAMADIAFFQRQNDSLQAL